MKTLYNPFSQFIETKFSPYAGLWRMNFCQKCLAVFNLVNGNLINCLLVDRADYPMAFGLFDYVTLPLPLIFKALETFDGPFSWSSKCEKIIGKTLTRIIIIGVFISFILIMGFLFAALLIRLFMTAVLVLLLLPIIELIHIASQAMGEGKALKNGASLLLITIEQNGQKQEVTLGDYLRMRQIDIATIASFYSFEVKEIVYIVMLGVGRERRFSINLEEAFKQPTALNAFLRLNLGGFTKELLETLTKNDRRDSNFDSYYKMLTRVYADSHQIDFEKLCFCALQAGHEIFATVLKELSFVSDETRVKLFLLYFFGNEHIAPNEAEAMSWIKQTLIPNRIPNLADLVFSKNTCLLVCDEILCRLYQQKVANDINQVNKLEDLMNALNERWKDSNDPEIQLKLYHIRLKSAWLAQDSDAVIQLSQSPDFNNPKLVLTGQDYFELGSLLLANQTAQSLIWKVFYQGWHLKKDENCFMVLAGLLCEHDSEKTNQAKKLIQLSDDDINLLIEKYILSPKNDVQSATSTPSPSHFSPVVSQKLLIGKNEDGNYPGMMEQRPVVVI